MSADRNLAELSRTQCMRLLDGASIGRVGVSIDAVPAILPVLIGVVDGSIVFQTVPGTKLAAAATRTVVAVEVDEYDPDHRRGWSVLVRGLATEITDPAMAARARAVLVSSWIGNGSAEHFVGVSPTS